MVAEEWQKALVLDELLRATDVGETRSRQQIQEACGLGSGDLDAVLTGLREAGRVHEATPDEWEITVPDDAREAAPGELPGKPRSEAQTAAAAMANRPVTAMQIGEYREEYGVAGGRATIRLTRGVMAALEAEVVGALVKAAVDEAPVGQPFVFEVV